MDVVTKILFLAKGGVCWVLGGGATADYVSARYPGQKPSTTIYDGSPVPRLNTISRSQNKDLSTKRLLKSISLLASL